MLKSLLNQSGPNGSLHSGSKQKLSVHTQKQKVELLHERGKSAKQVTTGDNLVDIQVEQALLDLNELQNEALKTRNISRGTSGSVNNRPETVPTMSCLNCNFGAG